MQEMNERIYSLRFKNLKKWMWIINTQFTRTEMIYKYEEIVSVN